MAYEAIPYPPSKDGALRRVRGAADHVSASVRGHFVYVAVIALYAVACPSIAGLVHATRVVNVNFYADIFVLLVSLFTGAVIIGHAIWMAAVVRPQGSLLSAIPRDFNDRFVSVPRVAGFFLAAAPAPLFMSVFGSYKRMIPFFDGFHWDATFMEWDKALHGGTQPWEILQPLLGTPIVTSAINVVYNLWLLVLFFTFIWQAWSHRRPALRMQYLLTFLFCWILVGSVMATLLASAGPCYYGRVTGLEDPYAPLMSYLYGVQEAGYPVWALEVQETLWRVYVSAGTTFGAGISAMPSLHVATSVLMALLGWGTNRWAGLGYTAFAAVIFIGSIHLGWHYAIDGYVSAAAVILLWRAVGWALRRKSGRGKAMAAVEAA